MSSILESNHRKEDGIMQPIMSVVRELAVRVAAIALMLLGVVALTSIDPVQASEKQPFSVAGTFVESCSCNAPCPCELVGVEMGCEGVGALSLTSGSYMGKALSDVKIVYATAPGNWVRLYVDAPSPSQREGAEAFGKAYFSGFGKVEAVKAAKVEITGKDGHYTVTVDGGKIMKYVTEPVIGGDGKTPIAHTNTKSMLSPTFLQGKTVSTEYHDGERSISLKGSNSYFNNQLKSSGKI